MFLLLTLLTLVPSAQSSNSFTGEGSHDRSYGEYQSPYMGDDSYSPYMEEEEYPGKEYELASRLFRDEKYHKYMRASRPPSDGPIIVNFTMTVAQIVALDEKSQTVKVSIWPMCRWNDPRLKFSEQEFPGIMTFRVPSDAIWLPDVVILNNDDGVYEPTYPANALISPNGDVQWLPPSIYVATCGMNMDLFPYDTQRCALNFVSVNYDHSEVRLHSEDPIYNDEQSSYNNTEWDLINVTMQDDSIRFPRGHVHSQVITTFHLKRKPLFYEVTLITPMVMLNMVCIMTFLLPSYGGTKLNITANIFLAFSTLLLIVVKMMPSTAHNVPLLVEFTFFSLLMTCLNTLFCVIVINIHWRSPNTDIMHEWFRWLVLETLPGFICMRRQKLEEERARQENLEQLELIYANEPTLYYHGMQVDMAIKNDFFRINSFSSTSPFSESDDSLNHTPELDSRRKLGASLPHCHLQPEEPEEQDNLLAFEEQLRALDVIDYIANCLRRKDDFERKNDDWTFAALVVNRMFFILYTTILLGGTYYIFFFS